MSDKSFLNWPFFEQRHRDLAAALEAWCVTHLPVDHTDVDAACRGLVAALGAGGWLQHSGGVLDVRSLCLIRETLARHDGLADFAFAMQGLGMGAVSLFGSPQQREWLDKTRAGTAIAAFALTEPLSGSDVAATSTVAERVQGGWRLTGEKTWISNGGIADIYVIFARTGEAPGARGLSAFLMPADVAGLSVVERLEVIAPHPLARLRLDGVELPDSDLTVLLVTTDAETGKKSGGTKATDSALIGTAGAGFKLAMAVLDVFRSTVGAAALGFARRALDEALTRVASRRIQGAALAELQMVQGHLADMALEVDAAALLVYRAAWTKDQGAARITREAAMAKLYATEAAQRVIDTAVQLHGGDGVRHGSVVERLYREIRALRIYEGASDVQRVVIARSILPKEAL